MNRRQIKSAKAGTQGAQRSNDLVRMDNIILTRAFQFVIGVVASMLGSLCMLVGCMIVDRTLALMGFACLIGGIIAIETEEDNE